MPWAEILPITLRPFGKKNYPSPHDPLHWLNTDYGKDWQKNCSTATWDYLNEGYTPKHMRVTVKCASLLKLFPFVRHIRGPADSYCKEELVFQGKVLNTFVRSAKGIPTC